MSQVVLSSVETAMKGMTVVLLGQAISMFFAFVTRLPLARYIPGDEFGVYTPVTSVASALGPSLYRLKKIPICSVAVADH